MERFGKMATQSMTWDGDAFGIRAKPRLENNPHRKGHLPLVFRKSGKQIFPTLLWEFAFSGRIPRDCSLIFVHVRVPLLAATTLPVHIYCTWQFFVAWPLHFPHHPFPKFCVCFHQRIFVQFGTDEEVGTDRAKAGSLQTGQMRACIRSLIQSFQHLCTLRAIRTGINLLDLR